MDALITALMEQISREAAGNDENAAELPFEPTEEFINGCYLP